MPSFNDGGLVTIKDMEKRDIFEDAGDQRSSSRARIVGRDGFWITVQVARDGCVDGRHVC